MTTRALVMKTMRLQLIVLTLVLNFNQVAHWQLHYQHFHARDNFSGPKMASTSWRQDNPWPMMLCYNLSPRSLRTGRLARDEKNSNRYEVLLWSSMHGSLEHQGQHEPCFEETFGAPHRDLATECSRGRLCETATSQAARERERECSSPKNIKK